MRKRITLTTQKITAMLMTKFLITQVTTAKAPTTTTATAPATSMATM